MYLSLNGTLVGSGKGWPEFARVAARVGFEGVDVHVAPVSSRVTPAITGSLDEARRLLAGLSLRAGCIGLPVVLDRAEETFRQGLEGLEGAVEFAVSAGCRRMVSGFQPSSEMPKAELWRVYRARVTACAEVLARWDMRLGLEFLAPLHLRRRFPYKFIWRMDEMLEFATQCGFNVGLLLDSWHWHHAGVTVADILSAGKVRIVHVQVADAPKLPPEETRNTERLLPGEGVIDLTGFFGALCKIGYAEPLARRSSDARSTFCRLTRALAWV